MTKTISSWLVTIALIVTSLGAMLPQTAHAQDYTEFCKNGGKLLLSELPSKNPCTTAGIFVAVELWSETSSGDKYGKKNFASYDELQKEGSDYTDGSVYFEAGAASAQLVEVSASTTTDSTSSSEVTLPMAWTSAVCLGHAAIVFQAETEDGDGVTVKTSDPIGCSEDGPWFVVEPWGRSGFNPDAGCFADNWAEVDALATRMRWFNGSAWKVGADYAENPLVVNCKTVTSGKTLGLNRYENQVKLSRLSWVRARANALLVTANMTLPEYCESYGGEPLGEQILCITTSE